ncbi:hypothetical protein AMTRI_Chr03g141310 [Amborella trichopoda]
MFRLIERNLICAVFLVFFVFQNQRNLAFVVHMEAINPIVTFVFQRASSYGLTVARTWAFSDGGYLPLQISLEARRYGIRLIRSFVNNYKDLGGGPPYVQWARNQGQSSNSDDDFYTNRVVKGYYKNHVRVMQISLSLSS